MEHEHTDESRDPGTTGTGEVNDDRMAQGVDHLQAAAREMIQAARAFLDVVEDFVGDEERMASVADAVAAVARGATKAVRGDEHATDSESTDQEPFGGTVQHIKVS